MNTGSVERLIAWLVPLVVLQAAGTTAATEAFRSVMGGSSFLGLSSGDALSLLSIAGPVLKLLVNGAVAVWLFIYAGRFGASRWLWFLFGAAFGVLALIVFLLVLVHEERSRKLEVKT